jgi:NTE family protein
MIMSGPPFKEPLSVTVVVGNAGIKSLAALPIIQFLQKEKIHIDRIIGSGGGTTLAALIGSGYSNDEIPSLMAELNDRKTIMNLNYKTLMELAGVPLGKFNPATAFLKAGRQQGLCKEIFEDRTFQEMTVPVNAQVVDIITGEGEILSEGSVADAVYASSAFYPFMSPIKIGENWYADGMYASTLPLLEATRLNAKMIVAIDFSRAHHALPHGLLEYYSNSINRTYGMMQTSQVSMGMLLQDIEIVLIKITFPHSICLWDAEYADEVLEAGYKALEMHKDEILVGYKGVGQ